MATVLPPSPSFTDGSHLFFVVFRKMVSFVSDCGHKKLLAWQYTVVIFDIKGLGTIRQVDFKNSNMCFLTMLERINVPLRQWCAGNGHLQLKGEHCQKPHCCNGIADMFRLRYLSS